MVSTPNAYYRCPCASESVHYSQDAANDEEEEERDFDPTTARANFSLSRLEQLFYCDTCHQIRCPKCVTEEILCWYCPNCLFEVPSSTVRSEGTRLVIISVRCDYVAKYES
jgi:dynactin 4